LKESMELERVGKLLLGSPNLGGPIGVRLPPLIAPNQELIIDGRERSKSIGRRERILPLLMKQVVLASNDPPIIGSFRHLHFDLAARRNGAQRIKPEESNIAQAQVNGDVHHTSL